PIERRIEFCVTVETSVPSILIEPL
ncbi:unnamed protein product, partial [Rotaria sp. Silwood1]